MNKIGFQNFRRFLDFEPIEYHGITFLVGRNNAGKSTLVKALLLLNDFFKSGNIKEFSFGNNVLEDANIVSYGRAKNSKAEQDFIKFKCQIDNYYTELTIFGDEDQTYAEVHSFLIRDIDKNLEFVFESKGWDFSIIRTRSVGKEIGAPLDSNISLLDIEIEGLRTEIDKSELKKSSKEFLFMVEEYNSLLEKRKLIKSSTDKEKNNVYSLSASFPDDFELEGMLRFMLEVAESDHDEDFREIQQGKEPSEHFETNRAVKEDYRLIEDSFNGFF